MFDKAKKFHEAIRQNDADQVTALATELKNRSGGKGHFNACQLAIEHNADHALRALLARNGFSFSRLSYAKDRNRAAQLVNAAKASSNPALLAALFETNQKAYYEIKLEDSFFVNKDISLESARLIVEKKPKFFEDFLQFNLNSVDKFKAILDITSTMPDPQLALNNTLVQIAEMGNVEMAEALLERKANPNSGSGKPLLRAAECGQMDMVNFLLQHTKPELCGDIVTLLQQQDNAPREEIICAIEKRAGTQNIHAETSQPQEVKTGKDKDGFLAESEDMLSETVTLSDGTQLMTLFNFSAGNAVAIHKMNGSTSSVASPVSFEAFKPEFIEQRREILEQKLEAQKVLNVPTRIARRLINKL